MVHADSASIEGGDRADGGGGAVGAQDGGSAPAAGEGDGDGGEGGGGGHSRPLRVSSSYVQCTAYDNSAFQFLCV